MADQQTLNASPIHAERSSDVSAMALEQKRAVTIAMVMEASGLVAVTPCKILSPGCRRRSGSG
jgi:hypothetical protein